jgi:hypothetical protein
MVFRKTSYYVILPLLLLTGVATEARADFITTTVWSSATDTHSTVSFAGNVLGTFSMPDIQTGTDTSFHWFPFGNVGFGADFLANISVPNTGAYTFSLTSDDASYLFIDGNLIVNDGGDHPPFTLTGSPTLTAGIHSVDVRYRENGVGLSGVDLRLPDGVSYIIVPEPTSIVSCFFGGMIVYSCYRWKVAR